MTETIDTGGPAYPIPETALCRTCGGWVTVKSLTGGMTKLEVYAKAALTGLLASPTPDGREAIANPEKAAYWAFDYARAMLAEAKRLGVTQQPDTRYGGWGACDKCREMVKNGTEHVCKGEFREAKP